VTALGHSPWTRRARSGDFYPAETGDLNLATSGDFLMATHTVAARPSFTLPRPARG
jgi:hypothetical protein